MFTYYHNRGLDCVEAIAKNLPNRTWWLPDLLCPEVISKVKEHVKNVEFYHIYDDLGWVVPSSANLDVIYTVDYFGRETVLNDMPSHTVIVRDSVWFPYPFTPVRPNEIWFNSLRKIFHAERGNKGAYIISPYMLRGIEPIPNLAKHPSLTWWGMNKRWDNYYLCRQIFSWYAIPNHIQRFPSVFPIILKNRDEILSKIDTPLPGMWSDSHNLGNLLYDRLAFIPLDSRFNKQRLSDLANRINELA